MLRSRARDVPSPEELPGRDVIFARRIGGNAARFIAQRHPWKEAAARRDECLTRLVGGTDA